ncbi:MAG: hypothetical protein HGA27_02125 [Peptococcaceae bacterium]|nr:hypothetical protein [Peptococcaceae bacterium]
MKRLSLVFFLVIILFIAACSLDYVKTESAFEGNLYSVKRVVDGDTIIVIIDGKEERLRLIGINTPETVHPAKGVEAFGREASEYTKGQLKGKEVALEFDVEKRDRYDRLLAYVWLEEKMLNELLVAKGYAQVATYPPNIKYVERFVAAQKLARENNLGLWGANQK